MEEFVLRMSLITALSVLAFAVVTFVDFHYPYQISELKYAVTRRRYRLASGIYLLVGLIGYVLLANILFALLGGWVELEKFVDARIATSLAASIATSVVVAAVAPSSIILLARHTAVIQTPISRLRTFLHRVVARFPEARNRVEALIATSKFSSSSNDPPTGPEDRSEFSRFGVSSANVAFAFGNDGKGLSLAAKSILQETSTLQNKLQLMKSSERFRKYFLARPNLLEDYKLQYQRTLRRTARALLMLDDGDFPSDYELPTEISDFVIEECDPILTGYRRLIAELALSEHSSRSDREQFISSFGYRIGSVETPPYASLVVLTSAFFLDFALSIAPIYFTERTAPSNDLLNGLSLVVYGLTHAIALTLAIFCAIWPKAATSFARPSLFSFPWPSYLFFGGLAYAVSVMGFWIAFLSIAMPTDSLSLSHPLISSSLIGIVFPAYTISISLLLDLRLRNRYAPSIRLRFRDGFVVAATVLVSVILVSLAFPLVRQAIEHRSGTVHWDLRLLVWSGDAMLALAIGYFAPSTAELYIESNRVVRRSSKNRVRIANAKQAAAGSLR
jgi:hypothetical protein